MAKSESHLSGYNILVLLYVSFAAFFYGYDSALTTSIFGYPQFIEFFQLDAVKLGAIGSCYYAGLTVGCIWNWWFPNKYGRLNDIRLACVIGLIGAAIQTGAQNFRMLLAGRIVGGLACGIVFSICPTYASEISPPALRGRVGAFYNFVLSSSYAITEWMGLGLSYVHGNAAWQIFIGLQLIAPIVMLAGSFFMHESPRYLVLKGRHEESLEVLKKMHGGKRSEGDTTFYLAEFHQIQTQLALEKAQHVDFRTIFTKKSYRYRFLLITITGSMGMLTGVIALQNYQYLIYITLGLTNKVSLALAGVWGTVLLPAIILGGYFSDKIGRKKSVYISMGIMITASTMLTICWARYSHSNNTNKAVGRAAVFSMFLFIFGYSWIMNALQFTYPAEICPAGIRHVGSAYVQTVANIWIIIIVQVAPIAIDAIGWKFFMIFIFCDVINLCLVIFLFPETNGKTLEEIASLFGDEVAETIEQAGEQVHNLEDRATGEKQDNHVSVTQAGEAKIEDGRNVEHIEQLIITQAEQEKRE